MAKDDGAGAGSTSALPACMRQGGPGPSARAGALKGWTSGPQGGPRPSWPPLASGAGLTVALVTLEARGLPRSRTYVDPTIGAELQRLQASDGSELVVDGRVVLAETSVRISQALGPLAVDAWLAMNAVWMEDGLGADGRCTARMRRVARLVWPLTPTSGGKTNRLVWPRTPTSGGKTNRLQGQVPLPSR